MLEVELAGDDEAGAEDAGDEAGLATGAALVEAGSALAGAEDAGDEEELPDEDLKKINNG